MTAGGAMAPLTKLNSRGAAPAPTAARWTKLAAINSGAGATNSAAGVVTTAPATRDNFE